MKYYYSDYVRHCLRFYSKFPDSPPEFRSEADRMDYLAAQQALASLTPDVRGQIISYYAASTPAPAVIIHDIERRTAVERGLR